jgi:hypothetical protein
MPTPLKRLIKKLFGIDEDEDDNNLLFLFLFLSLSDSGTDDPETLELLKYLEHLEPAFERIFERRFSFHEAPISSSLSISLSIPTRYASFGSTKDI